MLPPRTASSIFVPKSSLIWEYLCFGLPAKNSLFAVVKGGYFTEIFFFLKKSKQSGNSAWIFSKKKNYPGFNRKSEFFAGSPKQRYSQIKELLGTKILLAVRGGSTAIHLLPLLDKDKQDQQKIEDICFIGFSDVSVLLNHTAEKGGWAIHSHVANTLRLASLKEQKLFFSRLAGNWQGSLAGENQKQLVCLQQGKAEGILRGGNLTSLVSLVGSKWQVDFTNKILFLEDTNEAYYSIERLFSQLYYSGSLAKIKGLVLGHFLYATHPQQKRAKRAKTKTKPAKNFSLDRKSTACQNTNLGKFSSRTRIAKRTATYRS